MYIFPNYRSLHNWLEDNKHRIIHFSGVINLAQHQITFPNGNVLYLGHAQDERDKDKYLSLEYDTVSGYYNESLKYRELTRRRF